VYPGYGDVAESDWFYANAKLCYEVGLITGTDVGFEPQKVLTEAECVTLAARVGAALRGETIREAQEGESWWDPYNSYVYAQYGGGIESPDMAAGRWQFLFMLYPYVDEAGLLEPINDIQTLPDVTGDQMVLAYYNAGILTGVDEYGTFSGGKSLTRAEAAAMVSRIVRPELRLPFSPADYSPFTAAGMTPSTVVFQNGVTAGEFLPVVNDLIEELEAACTAQGVEFNWNATYGEETFLRYVKNGALAALGVTADQGTEAYKSFDVQVYYSRLMDQTGGPLG
jgi:hypothetical protein